MDKLNQIMYTAHTRTTGGRDGKSISNDGHLNVNLSLPKEMGGNGSATNPEQLFAAGYSACFISALKHVAALKKVKIPDNSSIDASVALGPIPRGFGIAVRLAITLPGIDNSTAQELVNAAHEICPYSNATRGNIEIEITIT